MSIINKIKNYISVHFKEGVYENGKSLNFSNIWILSFILTLAFAIIPVLFFAFLDYNVTRKSVESDASLRTLQLTSNMGRSVSFFLDERKSALKYAVYDNSFEELTNYKRLSEILKHLKKSFGGFSDLGVIDSSGLQKMYVGNYKLVGKDYRNQAWLQEVIERGEYISEVFSGFRNVPHLVIAIKHLQKDGSFYILRATIEDHFTKMFSDIKVLGVNDAFLINKDGILQTPSHYFGNVLKRVPIKTPKFSSKTEVIEIKTKTETPFIVGYKYIFKTPYILIVIRDKNRLMAPWRTTREDLIRDLSLSITVNFIWILAITTYLVNKLKLSDKKRVKYLHMAEYSNKLASIGRLAAGVAHEINNPLSIINEKAGLIKDILTFNKEKFYSKSPKLLESVETIIASVERCGRITKQLLGFARHMEVNIQPIEIKKLIDEVLSFLEREAIYRSINVIIDVSPEIPIFETDRGKMQQILLNIINNAFAAVKDTGQIKIKACLNSKDSVRIICKDNGKGISEKDLGYIFEPFFSTKKATEGTGLGLSITYGLIKKLKGQIDFSSKLGKGTTCTIILPLNLKKEGDSNENIVS